MSTDLIEFVDRLGPEYAELRRGGRRRGRAAASRQRVSAPPQATDLRQNDRERPIRPLAKLGGWDSNPQRLG